ncbi:MAG: RNA polymerase sigma factor [Myxococcales bacterium]|nr:RNA polymerase sigma factor [Myxococcales bacterium]
MPTDQRALRRLFEAHGQQVYRRALRLLGNPADAEEAMQEVFIRAARHLAELADGEPIRWLYRTTTNHCLNLMRDRKRRRELLDERGPRPEATTQDPSTLITLRALLAKADPREAQAVTYVYIDQLSQPEAADLMDVSVRSLAYLLASFRTWAKAQVGEGGVP